MIDQYLNHTIKRLRVMPTQVSIVAGWIVCASSRRPKVVEWGNDKTTSRHLRWTLAVGTVCLALLTGWSLPGVAHGRTASVSAVGFVACHAAGRRLRARGGNTRPYTIVSAGHVVAEHRIARGVRDQLDQTSTKTNGLIACVGTRQIDRGQFIHWLEVQRAITRSSASSDNGDVRNEVMGFLITRLWLEGEAHHLGIAVSTMAVHRAFSRLRQQQDPTPQQFRVLLRNTHQTRRDLLLRTRLQVLSERIRHRVIRCAEGAESAGRCPRLTHKKSSNRHSWAHPMDRFARFYDARWRSRTYCLANYSVAFCGHNLARRQYR